ncbi:MAG: GNAT family N-acetyltransferase [Thermoguttaceae bacterium]
MKYHVEVHCPVYHSFRVAQIAGMFDVPLENRSRASFTVETPPLEDRWRIGLILGPSGSGKTTVAKNLFGDSLFQNGVWPENKAVVDGFGDLSIKEITHYLTMVGFSSPPSWVKPYHVLSNGEKFRCDIAKALSTPSINKTVVFDEFTSVVDRNVAKVASSAISKGVKSGKIQNRFVAISCHYDIVDWLEPDWVLDMVTGSISRRSLRRPPIDLQIVGCNSRIWSLFAKHHYLMCEMNRGAKCYLALWNGEPVAFCAVLGLLGFKNRFRIHRIVTLPDYQGIGIGTSFLESVCSMYTQNKKRINIVSGHPALISHCRHSPKWKTVHLNKTGGSQQTFLGNKCKSSAGRCVVSFEYIGGF